MDFIIIDSNAQYAARLYSALTGLPKVADENIFDTSTFANSDSGLSRIADRVAETAKEGAFTILVNAESPLKDGLRQHQDIVDLIFWLRCKHKLLNTIAIYSVRSIGGLLKSKPANYAVISPGTYHFRLPLEYSDIEKINSLSPLEDVATIKPFLKPRISLERMRHTYANYAGISSMFDLARKAWDIKQIPKRFLDAADFSKVSNFKLSLDWHLLRAYFDMTLDEGVNTDRLKPSVVPSKVMLVDDLAGAGWKLVLSQMLFGKPDDDRLIALKLPISEKQVLQEIQQHRPDLLFLDLRLDGEEESTALDELSGYKILSFIKSHRKIRGLPVIMFTASNNVQTIKALMQNGADAVWTKPGLDEDLGSKGLQDRYIELLSLVDRTTDRLSRLALPTGGNQFGEFRIRLLERIERIKYRFGLYTSAELDAFQRVTSFTGFTDIYFDTNFFLHSDGDIVESLVNLYIISYVSANTRKVYEVDWRRFPYFEPKVVVPNQVFDELIKKVKRRNKPIDNLVYSIVWELSKGRVRTEYHHLTNDRNFRPQYKMHDPKENLYADPFLIDDVSNLVVLGYKKIKFEDPIRKDVDGEQKKVHLPNRRVLMVTDDTELAEKVDKMFSPQKFVRFSAEEFNREAKKISL